MAAGRIARRNNGTKGPSARRTQSQSGHLQFARVSHDATAVHFCDRFIFFPSFCLRVSRGLCAMLSFFACLLLLSVCLSVWLAGWLAFLHCLSLLQSKVFRVRGFCFLVRASTMRRVWRLRKPRVGTWSSSEPESTVRDLGDRSVSVPSSSSGAAAAAAAAAVATAGPWTSAVAAPSGVQVSASPATTRFKSACGQTFQKTQYVGQCRTGGMVQ